MLKRGPGELMFYGLPGGNKKKSIWKSAAKLFVKTY